MSLYMNKDKNVYKNKDQLNAPNQQIYVRNHMSEWLIKQEESQQSLVNAIRRLNDQVTDQGQRQQLNRQEILKQISSIQQESRQHETIERNVMQQLQMIEKDNQYFTERFEKGELSQQQITQRLQDIQKNQEGLQQIIESMQTTNDQMKEQMEEQTNTQQQVITRLEENDVESKEVYDRLDNQDALLEKVVRQMDHFRGVLYERTNYLAKKLESSAVYMVNKLAGTNSGKQREQVQTEKEKHNV